jgi:hypothetical protein
MMWDGILIGKLFGAGSRVGGVENRDIWFFFACCLLLGMGKIFR